MKKITLFIIAFLFTGLIYGQVTDSECKLNDYNKSHGFTVMNQNPQVIVVVDSKSIKLDDINDYDLKPKWIESVLVLKDDISKKIYGNENGVMIIYTKDKYRKKVFRKVQSKDGS